MNRSAGLSLLRHSPRAVSLAALIPAILAAVGCMHTQTRLQSEDESERNRYSVEIIRDKTTVANSDLQAVWGLGLVVGLNGTGSSPPQNSYRATLEDDLKKLKVENIR